MTMACRSLSLTPAAVAALGCSAAVRLQADFGPLSGAEPSRRGLVAQPARCRDGGSTRPGRSALEGAFLASHVRGADRCQGIGPSYCYFDNCAWWSKGPATTLSRWPVESSTTFPLFRLLRFARDGRIHLRSTT